eukprot:scaffold5043_cov117-Skeletonema_dohrnii-CCMP3373.AAC.2
MLMHTQHGSPASIDAWRQILSDDIDPKNLEAHVMLGWMLMATPPYQEEGIRLLENSFNEEKVSPTIDYNYPQTYIIAATIGRYRSQRNEYHKARKFTKIALELSKEHDNNAGGDLCIQMQLANMYDWFPNSTQAADDAITSMLSYSDKILSQDDNNGISWPVKDAEIAQMFPGAAADPYVHCSLSTFYLSFYYRADVALMSSINYEMARRGWPKLNTTAQFVKAYDEEVDHPCINRKIRLAIISGVLTEGHSNSESFKGVLSRLDRNIFEVTYVFLAEQGDTRIADFTKEHAADRRFVWTKTPGDVVDGAWTTKWGNKIASWNMDIIFYSDLTMSTFARRLGMQRLAPCRSVVQYFISWAAAELPLEESQAHYTEELKLISSDNIYMYYDRRVLDGEISRMDKMPFGGLTRSDLGVPLKEHFYLCMQKPFKFHPEVDTLFCGIMTKDPDGWLVLHQEVSQDNQEVFEKRLKRAGCDLSRIVFLKQQPHHRLLALYREAAVVLDSYPAGGDTTTREVIEMSKPLVTLPARLLGGRWSLGYLSNIGLKEDTKRALIASTPEEYVDLAVQLGTDDTLREAVEADLRECSSNLFHREEAVSAWQEMFLEISPYQRCQEGSEKEEMRHEEL